MRSKIVDSGTASPRIYVIMYTRTQKIENFEKLNARNDVHPNLDVALTDRMSRRQTTSWTTKSFLIQIFVVL